MRKFNRILPVLVCFTIMLSVAASCSLAYASDASASPFSADDSGIDGGGDTSASTGMFETTAALGKTLMDGIWSLFGVYVPGFSFTFGQMWLGVLLASVSVLVVRMIFGFGGSSGVSPRTGSTSNPKISKERRHDEF